MFAFRGAQCRRIQPTLWDYASERLPEAAMEHVEQHLRRCDGCNRELASLRRAQGLLAACRAQDEPAPRSDWSDLRQRIVADGLNQLAVPTAARQSRAKAWKTGFAPASRSVWALPLATFGAGGFAAVLLVAVGYHALTLNKPSGSAGADTRTMLPAPMFIADTRTPNVAGNTSSVAPIAPPASTAGMIANARPSAANGEERNAADNEAQMVAEVIRALNDTHLTSRTSASAASAAAFPAVSHSPANRVEHKTNHLETTAKFYPAQAANKTSRRDKQNVVRVNGKFRPYRIKPGERLTGNTQTQLASSYALERVQPVSNDSDDSMYVVGSVRPVSHEDDGGY